ncbi:cell wall proline rich protein [Stagonosporopsis vannaccii]|nr:cell wall proline rich protein [Stagonosporopsis vannaccii]
MAQIALPRHQATQSQSADAGSQLYQRRQQSNAAMVEMVPNPNFSFPMRGPDTSSNDSSPTKPRPMSMQYPAARRGSMPHARQKSVNALPAFSFNPSGNAPAPQQTSPQTSPLLSPTTPAKPMHGHRRGGSELIGGSARTGATLLSSSPTKDGSLSPPTTTLQPGPPPGRRGHAHRRSAAISSHDLSAIMNPPVPPVPPMPSRTGSAPNTPAENLNDFKFGHSVNKSLSQPCLRNSNSDDDSTPRPPSRARVGFSDKVEYIRPLSTISSETEVSTLRGHSNTNSLSSIVGGNTISPPFTRSGTPSLPTVEDESRPGTAGAILDKVLSNPLIEEASERKRPMSAGRSRSAGPSPTSPDMPTKKRGFFRLESRNSDKSNHRRLPLSISDPALTTTFNSSSLASPMDAEPTDDAKPKAKKSSHRPRKVKSWANSIIPRKSKHGKKSKRRAATPEQPDAVVEGDDTDSSDELDFDDFSPNFDDDNSVTIVSPTADAAPVPKINTDFASWQPRQLKRVDSDVMSPIIDMDAALGPFNTPNGADSRTQKRGFAAHRRAMHSASGFAPNHRRTESAPELVPFEFRPSAATNASPMADVFEEEEPEEEKPDSRKESIPTSIAEEPERVEEPKIQIVETDCRQDGPAINWNFNDGLGLRARTEPRHSPIMEEPLSPHAVPMSFPNPTYSQVEVVEDHEEPRTSSLTHSSDSTVTPQSTLEEFKDHQSTMAVPAPLAQQSLMTPNTVTSSFGSPDYRSSQISFDTPRVGTAASSVTDYPVMPSPRFGEPGPEMRMSSDDVPSLTSSRSTMTSNLQGTFPLPAPRRPGDRSASLCSTPSEVESRRRKRSSIASLSRLINGSYGSEKSKLSIEQRPQSAYLAPVAKDHKKKPRRLSKLKFWKSSKDSGSSSSQA